MMSVLLSMSPTSGFVSRSFWIWGLDRMSCLVIWGLEVESRLCTKGLPRTRRIISGLSNSCFSIWCWSAGKKPDSPVARPRLSTVGPRSNQEQECVNTIIHWSSCRLRFLPRQRGEVGDGVRLSWSGSRTSVSEDRSAAAEENWGLRRNNWAWSARANLMSGLWYLHRPFRFLVLIV